VPHADSAHVQRRYVANDGDVVFGDETGILVIPAQHLAVVLEKAMQLHRQEAAEVARLLGSQSANIQSRGGADG